MSTWIEDADAAARKALSTREQLKVRPDAREKLKRKEQELRAIRSSPWWKATAPGRRVTARLRRRSSKRTANTTPTAGVKQELLTADPPGEHDSVNAVNRRVAAALNQLGEPTTDLANLTDAITAIRNYLERVEPARSAMWLIFIAVVARFPNGQELELLNVTHQLDGSEATIDRLLESVATTPNSWATYADLEFVTFPLLDVSHTAQSNIHSGIQRVIREVVPRWAASHDLRLTIFDESAKCFRHLYDHEAARVLDWESVSALEVHASRSEPTAIVVPWDAVVILPEFAGQESRAEALICLADHSTNTLVSISYDLVPYLLPELCSNHIRHYFAETFSAIRSSARVSAISKSIADDLTMVARALPSIGMKQPTIRAHPLPTERLPDKLAKSQAGAPVLRELPEVPLVVSVGTLEPRKNQLRTLLAAEKLWSEGLAFELLFISWSSAPNYPMYEEVERLRHRNRPVRIVRKAPDAFLGWAYTNARFTVFVSRAEGYGLPIAESIVHGTPVLTSDFGSMAEIGAAGGAILVDPFDQLAVTDGMRRLLTDDDLVARLSDEARQRRMPQWDEYAKATWEWLVEGIDQPNESGAGERDNPKEAR